MTPIFLRIKILLVVAGITLVNASAMARDLGYGHHSVFAAGYEIKVFTYRSPVCASPSILFVFHGKNRKAESVRDKAVKIAKDSCLMVFAPLLDQDRFPNWRYHRAGVIKGGKVQPVSRWTYPILQGLIDFARNEVGHANTKLYLFGHSAGGQFLSRIAAYSPSLNADRIVVANPSVHVVPLSDEPVPYGYADIFSPELIPEKLKEYLATPITIYLGQEDTGSKYLVKTKAAMRQGRNRYERGKKIFKQAQEIAADNELEFNWKLVEVPGVGHSSRGMIKADEFYEALDLPDQRQLPDAARLDLDMPVNLPVANEIMSAIPEATTVR